MNFWAECKKGLSSPSKFLFQGKRDYLFHWYIFPSFCQFSGLSLILWYIRNLEVQYLQIFVWLNLETTTLKFPNIGISYKSSNFRTILIKNYKNDFWKKGCMIIGWFGKIADFSQIVPSFENYSQGLMSYSTPNLCIKDQQKVSCTWIKPKLWLNIGSGEFKITYN